MKRSLLLTLTALLLSFASFALTPITGPSSGCTGSTAYMADSLSPGGTWSSSNTTVATIGSTDGYVNALTAGTTTITYTLGGSYVTLAYTVNPGPAAISGSSSVCIGSTIVLTDATAGGTWSSSDSYVGSVTSSGMVSGVAAGTAYIYYTLPSGCSAYTPVSVLSATSYDSILGPSTVCVGSAIVLTAAGTSGGVWTSGSTSVATVSSTGVVTGVSAGADIITYTATTPCGSAVAYQYINVIAPGTAGTISGPTTVAAGSNISLTDGVSGGSWSSSNPSVATINTYGTITGITTGTVTMTYSVTSCGITSTATYTVTVTPANIISGYVHFPSAPFYGTVKVWLITYAAPNLLAVDSTNVYASGDSVLYQFSGASTDSYRIKAAIIDTMGLTTGYIPTYHTSSYYWYSATVLAHIAGNIDANQDINMAYGPVTSGPGFIGGNVTTGANKGTSVGVPVHNLTIYCVNAITNALMQYTHTDASGNYSFSHLPVGATYFIFPDSLNYMTTAYTGVSLTSGSPSMSGASFIQHTISKTITPVTEAVENITPTGTSVIAFPNPTMGKLNIQWNAPATEQGNISISDVTGREVYKNTISMHQGYGNTTVDMTAMNNGLYILSVKSASVNYSSKIQVQH